MIPGLPGLFVAGIFSAALSTLSTGLNSLSCIICQDVIKPCVEKPLTERQTAILLRLLVVVFGFMCICLVFVVENMGTVLPLATMLSGVTMGPLLAFYTIGVCLPWFNSKVAYYAPSLQIYKFLIKYCRVCWQVALYHCWQCLGYVAMRSCSICVAKINIPSCRYRWRAAQLLLSL